MKKLAHARGHLVKLPPRSLDRDAAGTTTRYDRVSERIEAPSPHRPPHPADPSPAQRMGIVESSGVLDFWNREQEDVYKPDDGSPV